MKKCTTQEASYLIDDLFGFLAIKNQQPLYNGLVELLCEFSLKSVRDGWKDLMDGCSLPNGQLCGQVPKFGTIRAIFDNKRIQETQLYDNVEELPVDQRKQLGIFLRMCQSDMSRIKRGEISKKDSLQNHYDYLSKVGADTTGMVERIAEL